ncbi:MAG TPA: hypothetical protein VHG93_13670 [Longimicrobium sp.]|nr:hypothetical protein [Longimicrobium sp.]
MLSKPAVDLRLLGNRKARLYEVVVPAQPGGEQVQVDRVAESVVTQREMEVAAVEKISSFGGRG